MARVRVACIAFVPAFVLLASTAPAQSENATISGRITDQTGQEISDARVVLSNESTGVAQPSLSNADGIYVAADLRPGRYRMVVEKDGFTSIVLDGLVVAVQDVLGRNFTMQVSPVKQTVTVTAGDRERSLSPAVSTVVNPRFVEDMPLNGRSFQSLIQLTPGVLVMASGQGIEGQFVTNGQRSNTNYFTVDGVSVNFATNLAVSLGHNLGGALPALTIAGGTNGFASVEAIQEFRIQTSSYAPEFGRMPGAQIAIVTKSGSNEFHGSAYDYVRNESLDARNWFNPPPDPKPPLRQQNFGGTLGGPLLRKRTFFFVSYEGLRLEQPHPSSGYFYTPATRAAVAALYRPIVNALPIPAGALQDPTCDDVARPCRARLSIVDSDPTSFDGFSIRLDHALTPLTLFTRVTHAPSSTRSRSFSSVETYSRNTDMVNAGATAILNPRMVNDLRGSWGGATGRVDVGMDDLYGAVRPPEASLFAGGRTPGRALVLLSLPDGNTVGFGTRVHREADQINVADSLSLVTGAHQLKFGVDYRRFQVADRGRNLAAVTINSFDQLKSGTMGAVLTSASDALTARSSNWSLFGQDTWTAGDRLTVTYGVRWDVNTPPVSTTPGKPLYAIEGVFDSKPLRLAPAGTPLWRTQYDGVAPRLGAAYELSPSTIVRGGAGLVRDLGYGRLLGSLISGFPYSRDLIKPASGRPFDPADPILDPAPFSTAFGSLTSVGLAAFDPELRLPSTTQWNVAVERALGSTNSVTVTYVGASGQNLLRPDFVIPSGSSSVRIAATRNAGDSEYRALQAQVQHRLSHGLQGLASYTLAESRDRESDDGGGNFLGAPLNANYASSLSRVYVPPLAPSDFDVRHSFSAAVSYEIPGPRASGVGAAILKDWAMDAIVRASSAPPLNVRIEGVSAELGAYRTQPDLVPGQPIWLVAPDQPGGRILNPDAFTLPPPGAPGNFLRNSIRSPFAINQTDFSLRRRFSFADGKSLELRADVFNLFNQPMFGGAATLWGRCTRQPCTGQNSPLFGTVGGATLNEALGGDPLSGGQSAIYAVGGPRSIQLSAKLRF